MINYLPNKLINVTKGFSKMLKNKNKKRFITLSEKYCLMRAKTYLELITQYYNTRLIKKT